MTVPAAAAPIGVPGRAAMSIPSCIRPQRNPNPEVSGPLTGHENCPLPPTLTVDGKLTDPDRIWAASFAERARRPRASASSCLRSPLTLDSSVARALRAATSLFFSVAMTETA